MSENLNNPEAMAILLSIANSIFHIIESILSQEELPDFYEEQLPQLTQYMMNILQLDTSNMQKVPDELFKARGKIVSLVHLYTCKFGEYFQNYE